MQKIFVFISFFFALTVKLHKLSLSDEVGEEQRINLQLTGKISLKLDSQLKFAFGIRPSIILFHF